MTALSLSIERYLARLGEQPQEIVLDIASRKRGRPKSVTPAIPGLDKHNTKKATRAAKAVAKIRDLRRNRFPTPATGKANREVSPDLTGTVFPQTVAEPGANDTCLMPGEYNEKLGGIVMVGRLKGARIVYLNLEERKTCPRSCTMWTTCMGNNMGRAKRWIWNAVTRAKIEDELVTLCRENRGILIRLHGLGDFVDPAAVLFWAKALEKHPNLFIFGFTAHEPESVTGRAVAGLRDAMPGRFMIRHSSPIRCQFGEWRSYVIDTPTDLPVIGGATVCPEQRDTNNGGAKKLHCGACGFCWAVSHPLIFIQH